MQKVNRGRGLVSGVWEFDEFEFLPGILGRGIVFYAADAKRLGSHEVTDGLCGRPYEIQLSEPSVESVELIDDAGETIPLDDNDLRACQEKILSAWRDAADHIVDFEMGLL